MARVRLISRLTVSFLLDMIGIARGDGHILDALLMSAIIQANIEEINRRGDLQVEFALSDEAPPDDLRRPVSMNALASSLDQPFETVRRRVKGMVRQGLCKFVDGGVIVPTAVLNQPKYYADGFRVFERVRAFYYQLSDLGLLVDLPQPTVRLSANMFPVRAVARLAGAYVLRVIEALGEAGDLVDSLIVLEIFRCNVEHLPPLPGGGADTGPGGMVPDSLRRPIPVTALAARIGVPQETVRRHVTGLMARGLCVRVRGGLVVPAQSLNNPYMGAAVTSNVANLHRLFGAYAQLGVLQVWDTVRPQP